MRAIFLCFSPLTGIFRGIRSHPLKPYLSGGCDDACRPSGYPRIPEILLTVALPPAPIPLPSA